jgi:hypothetical protein
MGDIGISNTNKNWSTRHGVIGCLLLAQIAWSQQPSSTPSSGELSTITVQGVAPENAVLPTVAPISSAYGTDMSILDTPRNVTVVSQEILKTTDIRRVEDFLKVAPSVYTNNQWGGANTPMIRGQMAEVFQNGVERTTKTDGLPFSFNSVESMDVIPGPASSVYGPSQYTGGYINLTTKQPYFDGFHGSSSFTAGYWDTYRWQEDFGGPIIPDKLAFRLSYEGENSQSFYNNVVTQSQDIYFALTYTPSDRFTVKFNTELFVDRFNEPAGWNRPTQQLIDDGLYITGEPVGGRQFLGVIIPTGVTRIGRSVTLIAPSDSDYGKDYNAQLEATLVINDNISLVNRAFFEYYYQRDREDAQRWNNLVNSKVVQDRLELHIDYDLPFGWASGGEPPVNGKQPVSLIPNSGVMKNNIITGVAFKFVDVTSYEDFFNEYLNGQDLTLSPSTFPITNLFGVLRIPGTDNLYGATAVGYNSQYPFSIPGTLREVAYEASWFFQDNVAITNHLNVLFGGRLDLIADSASDPLAPPGYTPASDSTSQLLYSGNISMTYKTTDWMTNYFTAEFNESFEGSYSGGFAYLSQYALGVGRLPSVNYHYENVLYEAGAKFDLLDHKLFVSLAGYHQEHNVTTTLGAVTAVRTNGAELVTTYQPNKNFYTNFSLSYIDSVEVDPGTSQQTRNVYDAFAAPVGTGVGSPNFLPYAPGHYRQPGLPHWLINGIASYELNCGLGASLNFVVTSPIPTSELQNVWIPWQYELDASIFYKRKNFEARINFLNITDQKNFSTGGSWSQNGNDLVAPLLPFHIEGTVTIRF